MTPNDPIESTPTSAPVSTDQTQTPPILGAPKSKKGLIIGLIAGGAVLLVGLAILLFFLLGNKGSDTASTGNPVVDAVKDVVTPENEVVDRPDGTLDLSDKVDGNKEVANQDITAKLNQQVNLSDGGSFMVTKVERNFTGFDARYFKVKEGEEAVAVTIVAGSRSTAGTGINKNALTLSAPSNDAIKSTFASSLAKVDGLLDSANNLEEGQQVSGKLLWIVKSGETPLALKYSVSYTNYTTAAVVTLKAAINL